MIITIGGMNKDIKQLQAQIKLLQDLVVSQADKISVLEEEIGQVSLTPSPPCFKCSGTGIKTLTPSPSSSKPRMDKGVKGGKNK